MANIVGLLLAPVLVVVWTIALFGVFIGLIYVVAAIASSIGGLTTGKNQG